ncbi:MAG: hypothetical protein J5701_07175 [Bacteroidales bacterium]|nr:hypothetical protein [Bacteroidales bacterium]
MGKGKVLVLDSVHPDMIARLSDLGYECEVIAMDYPELLAGISAYTGLVIRSRCAVDKPVIDAAVRLKFIARVGAGMENIDTLYARQKGIACLNSPEGNADAVGEYVIGSLLALFRHTVQADIQVRRGEWQRKSNTGLELNSKTVGIIGYGNMGHSVAKKLSGFGCKVLVYDKYKQNYGDAYAEQVSLETLRQQADIVSVHINYMPENHYYINGSFIHDFKKQIYIVNTSRGKVLNTSDLAEALSEGKVSGAVLDVLEYEDIRLQNAPKEQWDEAMQKLAQNANVILSPHIAGQTYESQIKHVKVLAEKIKQLSLE